MLEGDATELVMLLKFAQQRRKAERDLPIVAANGLPESCTMKQVGIIVAGSAVFHSDDPERATRELKAAAMSAL